MTTNDEFLPPCGRLTRCQTQLCKNQQQQRINFGICVWPRSCRQPHGLSLCHRKSWFASLLLLFCVFQIPNAEYIKSISEVCLSLLRPVHRFLDESSDRFICAMFTRRFVTKLKVQYSVSWESLLHGKVGECHAKVFMSLNELEKCFQRQCVVNFKLHLTFFMERSFSGESFQLKGTSLF